MNYKSQINSYQEDATTFVDDEIVELFQVKINPNLTPEQINIIVNALEPRPNPISGQIINLLYVEDNNNLEAITIQTEISGNIFVFASDPNISSATNTIKVDNLEAFRFRLQEAFNFNSSVIIKYDRDSNRIISLMVTKPIQTPVITLSGNASPQSNGSPCYYPRYC